MGLHKKYTSLKTGNFTKEVPCEYRMISDHIIKNILKSANSEINILEIGCGEGNLMQYLKNKFICKILGIDISTKQVALAREKNLKQVQDIGFLAEGYFSCKSVNSLAKEFDIEMPICNAVKELLSGSSINEIINRLLSRPLQFEDF